MQLLRRTFLLLGLLALAGCTATHVRAYEPTSVAQLLAASKPYLDKGYIIAIGDTIGTRCYFNPQLDEEVLVGPDGNIGLSLVGQFKAAGKTPKELSAEVTKAYAVHFQKATAVVYVRQFMGHRIFTAGELKLPGMFSLVNSATTVLESISMSGGATQEAGLHKVILVRKLPNHAEPMFVQLDVVRALSGVDGSQNVVLMPGDYVYVPRSGAAELNLVMKQYLLNNFNTSTQMGLTFPPVDIAR